jgi:hypothetical protein
MFLIEGFLEMANMFAKLAKRATQLSPIMDGREKITTEEVISTYPDGITITAFDLITTPDSNGNPQTYPVIAFDEDKTKFIYGGKAMSDVVSLWVANFDGDIEATSNALSAAGGVKIKMFASKTRTGRNFTQIEVVG